MIQNNKIGIHKHCVCQFYWTGQNYSKIEMMKMWVWRSRRKEGKPKEEEFTVHSTWVTKNSFVDYYQQERKSYVYTTSQLNCCCNRPSNLVVKTMLTIYGWNIIYLSKCNDICDVGLPNISTTGFVEDSKTLASLLTGEPHNF